MAGRRAHAQAVGLVVLFVLSTWLHAVGPVLQHSSTLANENVVKSAGAGDEVNLTLTSTPNTMFKLDLPNNEPLVSAEMQFTPRVLPTQSGFTWNSDSIWSHPDAISNGSSSSGGILTGSSPGILWDFNTNNQGWTFSNSYTARVTSPSCGFNGSTGGSLRTYAGSTYGTSPVVNLAGGANVPFHAWVHEGRSGCGETPDSGENLQFQYKAASGSWTTFRTFSGGGAQTSNFQFMTTLPAAALHVNSQFRIHQTSGSSTCCDYWFVDDVHIATPPESNWTSPTLGYKSGSTQLLAADTYAPMTIQADVPDGAYLNWSILNSAGEVIPGMRGSNDYVVPINLLDHDLIDQFRLHLEFKGSASGMPEVHSITGDGAYHESFITDPLTRGWTMSNASYVPGIGVLGSDENSTLTSPWVLANAPLYDAKLDGTVASGQVQVRFHPEDAWMNVSLPYFPMTNQSTVGMQARVVSVLPADGNMSNFTAWNAEAFSMDLFGGQHPARPTLDFNLDERYEWGGEDARVGTWGWQDRFANAEEQMELTLTSGAPSDARLWVPSEDLTSFGFGYAATSGTVLEIALFVQNTLVANRSTNATSAGLFHLNGSELAMFNTALANTANSVDIHDTAFTEVRIEVSGNGVTVLGGLRATYEASQHLVADASSAFVMGVNEARTTVAGVAGMQSIPLPFMSETRGGLTVEVLSLQTSSTVILQDGAMVDAEAVLTPSKEWQTISTQYQVIGGSITHHRLDVYSKTNQATFLFPDAGGAPAGLGDASLVELHPTDPIDVTEDGTNVVTNITFRLRPTWDDEQQLTATSRLVMQSGVISIPFAHTWGGTGLQGYENDLEIKGVVFSENGVDMSPSRVYLRGGESMNVSVRVGYEDVNDARGFVDGDAELTLYRDGTAVRNTTSLDGAFWNFTETIPFTYGDVTWEVGLVSFNGSTVVEPSSLSRTFTVDSVKPRVMETSMYRYDHRTPSPTQVMQATIADQPVLPSAMTAMVWKEWVDDTNLNGWPDEGEYHAMPMLVPSDQTALTGVYTLMLDDTGGSLGQKVAVYLEGTDPSGYALQDGGSAEEGEQLFMYQLAVDGAPELEPDAFAWSNGRQSWLHPAQPYELNVKISEPNGGSDLSTVEVMLASNQGSDAMSIQWAFETGECTTASTHIIIDQCTMLGANGVADPYEKDLVLNIHLQLGWNTPDLGDNRREPAILVVDRAGQEEMRNFPEHRWRFSAGLSIPEESVNLHLTRGSFLGDGARVTPLTPMELSGGLVFAETSTVPDFDCTVNILFAGQTHAVEAKDGIWSTAIDAPASSGSLPMTWEVGCLEGQGVDLTDQSTSVKWIVVDGTGPEPQEVLSPRPRAVLGGENHEVRVVVQELGGLDVDSLELVWQVEDFETGDVIRSGREPLTLEGEAIDGLRLELYGDMNLSEITNAMLIDRMEVKISIAGRDLAGNTVTGLGGDLNDPFLATWNMEWLQPKFTVAPSALTYSRLLMEEGDTTSIQLEVENIGSLQGQTGVSFETVTAEGERTLIQRTDVTAEAGALGLVAVDWQPETAGIQWVEATLDNGMVVSGPTIEVRVAEEPTFSEKVFGDVNPIIGSLTGLLLVAVVVSLLAWMRRMTVNQGARSEFDWDEYSSEFEDDDDDDDDDDFTPDNTAQVAAATVTASTESTNGNEAETDWVMGSDGYWWYHDKATNEWWYKDANGDIVKHP